MKKVKLLDVCNVYQPKTVATKYFVENGPYVVYGANGPIGRYSEYNHEESEVLMACRGATCGTINVSESYSWINGNAMVIKPNGSFDLDKKYLKYYLMYAPKDSIITGTAQPQITRQNLKHFIISICDISEQQRIVARIEELFSQLDDAEATLQKTKAQLALYRQAVLREAFSFDCLKAPIRSISHIVTSGSRGWAKYYSDSGARFIRITDLTRERINLLNDDIQRVELPDSVEGKRSRLQANDVLVSITADLGSIAIIPDDIGEAYINQHIAMIRFRNPEQGLFMAWYLKSDYGQKDLLRNKRGNGKLGLSLDDIRDTPVPIVDSSITASIVNRIEKQLSICDYIERTTEAAIIHSTRLRQSMLARSFEGEL